MKVKPDFSHEHHVWEKDILAIGCDEVGRGCFAGPIVAAAVVFPAHFDKTKASEKLFDVADSKTLSPKKREMLSLVIQEHAKAFAIATVSLETINTVGIGKANQQALFEAVQEVEKKLECDAFVFCDGFLITSLDSSKQQAIVKGDMLCFSIAAASILAKVYRDNLMQTLHQQYPQYNFSQNKGYGTKEHQNAIKKYGLSPLHRTSFSLDKFL